MRSSPARAPSQYGWVSGVGLGTGLSTFICRQRGTSPEAGSGSLRLLPGPWPGVLRQLPARRPLLEERGYALTRIRLPAGPPEGLALQGVGGVPIRLGQEPVDQALRDRGRRGGDVGGDVPGQLHSRRQHLIPL